MIWASVVLRFFQNWLESLWFIWSLNVHLSMYVNLDCASLYSWFLCSLLMYVCRFRIAPVWVHVGTPLSQYNIVRVVCILGVLEVCLGELHHLLVDLLFHCLLCMCML